MTEPPKTVAEFEDLLAKAKTAGLLPIMAWNATASGGGLAFPLQNLMAAYGPTQPINDWIFQKPGATIDTPTNLRPPSISSNGSRPATSRRTRTRPNTPTPTRASARVKACSCSTVTGRTRLRQGPGRQRRVLRLPAGDAGGKLAAMSAPLTYGIAAKAKNADCAALFFNWVATNETARQIDVAVGGSNPGGPTDLAVPPAAAGSVTNEHAGGRRRCRPRTMARWTSSPTPPGRSSPRAGRLNSRRWSAGKQDAAGLLKAVQAEYQKELSR